MNAKELMDELFLMDTMADYTHTRDIFVAGDPEKKIKKVGVCMFSSVDVIREAMKWGCDLLIPHESTFINRGDKTDTDPMINAKKALGTQMKATGEVMSIANNFEAAILKAVRSLEIGTRHVWLEALDEPVLFKAGKTY